MDPVIQRALDNQELMLVHQLWMINVLYVVIAVVALKLLLTGWIAWATLASTRRMDATALETRLLNVKMRDLTAKVETMLHLIKAEGTITDRQKERTEQVLTQIQHDLPRVAAEAVQQAVTGIPAGATPAEGTLKVVVVNSAEHPVPVAQAVPEG